MHVRMYDYVSSLLPQCHRIASRATLSCFNPSSFSVLFQCQYAILTEEMRAYIPRNAFSIVATVHPCDIDDWDEVMYGASTGGVHDSPSG